MPRHCSSTVSENTKSWHPHSAARQTVAQTDPRSANDDSEGYFVVIRVFCFECGLSNTENWLLEEITKIAIAHISRYSEISLIYLFRCARLASASIVAQASI